MKEENLSVNTDLVRGHVITFILSSLELEDKYGYEIMKEIETKSQGSYKLKQPTLYSCLKRLENLKYITSYDGEVSNGGKRRYYTLTDKGRDYLEKDKAEWEFSRSLLDKLVSDKDYDLTTPPPFLASNLRPYTKKLEENEACNSNVEAQVGKQTEADEEKKQVEGYPKEHSANLFEYLEKKDGKQSENNGFVDNKKSDISNDTSANNTFEAPIPDVNYKEAFSELFSSTKPEVQKVEKIKYTSEDTSKKVLGFSELQHKLFGMGYKLRPYSKSNVNSFYSMNFLFANKINAVTYWLIYAIMVLEIAIGFTCFREQIGFSNGVYIAGVLVALLVPALPTYKLITDPNKKIKAKFDMRASILSKLMLFLNLTLIVACCGFFVFQADIQNFATLIKPILVPLILLTNLPLTSVVYYLLFKSKRFHLS